jgi:hypothetical protein
MGEPETECPPRLADLLPPPRGTVLLLSAGAAAVAAAGAIGQWLRYRHGVRGSWFVDAFNLDREGNVATWYSTGLLLLAALLLAALARLKPEGPHPRFWAALSAVFMLLSLDEAAALHEATIQPVRRALGVGGALYYAWVVPGAAFAVIVLAGSWRFLRRLPAGTRRLFLIGGAVYVSGAIGVEMVGSSYDVTHGAHNLRYAAIAHCEEMLEMAGVLVFIYALLAYLRAVLVGRQAPGRRHVVEAAGEGPFSGAAAGRVAGRSPVAGLGGGVTGGSTCTPGDRTSAA